MSGSAGVVVTTNFAGNYLVGLFVWGVSLKIGLVFGHIDITTVTLETLSLQSVGAAAWRCHRIEPPVPHPDARCSTPPAVGGAGSSGASSRTAVPLRRYS